jgi:ATP/maltotriose-dependent transcriptional regulator MalT
LSHLPLFATILILPPKVIHACLRVFMMNQPRNLYLFLLIRLQPIQYIVNG